MSIKVLGLSLLRVFYFNRLVAERSGAYSFVFMPLVLLECSQNGTFCYDTVEVRNGLNSFRLKIRLCETTITWPPWKLACYRYEISLIKRCTTYTYSLVVTSCAILCAVTKGATISFVGGGGWVVSGHWLAKFKFAFDKFVLLNVGVQ